ncbi:MAG: TetR/AcrR family transcriptional regulator [bacterium]|nr:TetR/AcrR family transcriptional regulator [bacterium]
MVRASPDSDTRSRQRDLRRNSLLDAAEGVFGANGFKKATIGDIAEAAGASRPLVYRYFSDKEKLFEAVVDRILHEWNEVLTAEASRTTPGTAHTLRLVLTASLDFARERHVLRGLLARDSRRALADYSDVIEQGSEMLRTLLANVLRAGVQRGDVRGDLNVEDVAHVVSEVFLAYADHIVSGDDAGLGERRVEAILETLLHGLIVTPIQSHSGA